MTVRPGATCEWCGGPIPVNKRRDTRFDKKTCRQASWRFGRPDASLVDVDARRLAAGPPRRLASSEPRRFAYADPPYPGKAHLYAGHPDFGGEVDHRELVDRLVAEYPDGWALSTSSDALFDVLALCPRDVRVGVWTKPCPPGYQKRARRGWEPVIFCGGRERERGEPQVLDWVHAAPLRRYPGRVIGIKPPEFSWWLFAMLGARAGDTLDDLFPGSGAVTRAWQRFVEASRSDRGPAVARDVAEGVAAVLRDASGRPWEQPALVGGPETSGVAAGG